MDTTDRRSEDRREERSPAEILEEHGRESIDRINKIDAWVHRVSLGLIGMVAAMAVAGALVTGAFVYLLHEIQGSRWETAVKSCQINRQSTHDGLQALMQGLSKTEAQKAQSAALADRYFPYTREDCEKYAAQVGLEP